MDNEIAKKVLTTPGIHPLLMEKKGKFQPSTWKVIELFSITWFISHGYANHTLSRSYYDVIFIKPTQDIEVKFNLSREIIVIFSNYERFEPRCLDAIDNIRDINPGLRFEEICSIVVSKDEEIQDKLKLLYKNNQESQIVIPFSYSDFSKKKYTASLIENRIRSYFYTRDLFAFTSPLQSDLFFFGRSDLVSTIISRQISSENTGLFGLRKSGKTSILYAVQRAAERRSIASLIIDCENTSILNRKWYETLFYINDLLHKKYSIPYPRKEEDYDIKNASDAFKDDLTTFISKTDFTSIILLFDEVERITYGISDIKHWREDLDFVMLWRAIRANLQTNPGLFSYVISSTNPRAIEYPRFGNSENPIYSHVKTYYIGQFSIEETRNMVEKLGGYMGLIFDHDVYTYLTREYGGHPFLIRHLCSTIHETARSKRPTRVTRGTYNAAKRKFETQTDKGISYSKMILDVLHQYYPDEYKLLISLAIGETDYFDAQTEKSPAYTAHLLGYGIIEYTDESYDFRIDTLKKYLLDNNKYRSLNTSNEERRSEVSERRNYIEEQLRNMIRRQLRALWGTEEAKKIILHSFNSNKAAKASSLPYVELFNPNHQYIEFYLTTCRDIIKREYEYSFRNIFDCPVEEFENNIYILNKIRVGDTHAATVTDDMMLKFRGAAIWFENVFNRYNE